MSQSNIPLDTNAPKVRVHVMLFEEDWEALSVLFSGQGKLGRSEAVRVIVHDYIERIRAKAAREEQRVTIDDNLANSIAAGLTPGKNQSQHHQ